MKIIKTSGCLVSFFEEDLTLAEAKNKLLFLKKIKQGCKELKNKGRMLVCENAVYSIVSNTCQGYKPKHSY